MTITFELVKTVALCVIAWHSLGILNNLRVISECFASRELREREPLEDIICVRKETGDVS